MPEKFAAIFVFVVVAVYAAEPSQYLRFSLTQSARARTLTLNGIMFAGVAPVGGPRKAQRDIFCRPAPEHTIAEIKY